MISRAALSCREQVSFLDQLDRGKSALERSFVQIENPPKRRQMGGAQYFEQFRCEFCGLENHNPTTSSLWADETHANLSERENKNRKSACV